MSPRDTGGAAFGSETILLVDADPETRKLGAFMLEKRGYRVLEARSAPEAIAVFEACGGVDLLLTEVLLPKTSGLDLAAQLLEAQPGLRILLMSHSDYRSLSRQLEITRDRGFLQKPFTMRMLAGKVREVLDAPLARAAGITQ